MPLFLDLFIEELRRKKETIRNLVDPFNLASEIYSDALARHWNPINVEGKVNGNVVAIDSSGRPIELRNGAIVYVARAMALSNTGFKHRKLTVKAFFSPTSSNDFNTFMVRVMEHLEHLVALDVIREYEPSLIMLDGSLYGRAVHMPKDTNIQAHNSFMVDYIHTYYELLEEAKRRNILLIGVSKDSSLRKLRELLLIESLSSVLNLYNLTKEYKEILINKLCSLLTGAREPRYNLREIKGILREIGLQGLEKYYIEAITAGPDFHLLSWFVREEGFTDPFLLGMPVKEVEVLRRPREYISRSFIKSLNEAEEPELLYLKIMEALDKVLRYPAIMTFYYIPHRRDIPIRVDAPAYMFGIMTRISEVTSSFFIDSYDNDTLITILQLLKGLYAGAKKYNVLLSEVDSLVKMSNRDVVNVYEPLIAKELGVLIEHTRDLRRVIYP